MKFTVTWRKQAEDQLAEIWLRAKNRQAVADAADRADAYLRTMPHEGHPGLLGTRLLWSPPLLLLYELSEQDCQVHVLAVREHPPQ